MAFQKINNEQKIRISLSQLALDIIRYDMEIFNINNPSNFINLVIKNFREEAKASVSTYVKREEEKITDALKTIKLSTADRERVIAHIGKLAKESVLSEIQLLLSNNNESKVYYISDDNIEYLASNCGDSDYYKKPGDYLKCIIEEYARLPFIKRERICKKDVYDTIQHAVLTKTQLKIKVRYYDRELILRVYPYKIMSDMFESQEYLACYSYESTQSSRDKIMASFSLARLDKVTKINEVAFLSRNDIDRLNEAISTRSIAYLIENPQNQIKVKLTENGKKSYISRLRGRPFKNHNLSSDDIYVFNCTERQAFEYFFSFGKEAEIIEPETLRERMKRSYEAAAENYKTST